MNMLIYEKAINTFSNLIKMFPEYKKNGYLLSAIALKKKGLFAKGIEILSKGIQIF
jgi:tetratricopeptide (TPR) repeat protein